MKVQIMFQDGANSKNEHYKNHSLEKYQLFYVISSTSYQIDKIHSVNRENGKTFFTASTNGLYKWVGSSNVPKWM